MAKKTKTPKQKDPKQKLSKQTKSGGKKIWFMQMLLLFGLVPMLTISTVLSLISAQKMRTNIEQNVYDQLSVAASSAVSYFSWGIMATGNATVDYDFIDSLVDSADIQLALFKDDWNQQTSILNEFGTRDIGVQAPSDIWQIVSGGEDYQASNIPICGNEYYVYYKPIYADEAHTRVWGMALAAKPRSFVRGALINVATSQVGVTIPVGIACAVFLIVIARKLRNSLNDTVLAIDSLANGEISKPVTATSKIHEVVLIDEAATTLQKQLFETIGHVRETSEHLGRSVYTVDQLSETSADGAEKINRAVSELATTASNMANTVDDTNSAVVAMGENIDEITEKSHMMASSSEHMKTVNANALAHMEDVHKSSINSVEAIESINQQTLETNAAVDEIKHAAELIRDIASQTNLLALNASIESARAGEAGRGFAVVAENIKGLAEQSGESANSIKNMVENIVTLSGRSVEMTQDIMTVIKEQQKQVEDASAQMEQLSKAVLEMTNSVEVIDACAEKLDSAKNTVLSNINDLSAISQENAASSQEVTASVESITDGINGTMQESTEMRQIADNLTEQMTFFR